MDSRGYKLDCTLSSEEFMAGVEFNEDVRTEFCVGVSLSIDVDVDVDVDVESE